MKEQLPNISIHPHTQKSRSTNEEQNGIYWPEILKEEDFKQMCILATGKSEYNLTWLNEDEIINSGNKNYKYNVGNVVIINFEGIRTYITLGYPYNDGRNSYFQQIGPAYRRYIEDSQMIKKFMFYALPIARPKDFGRVLTLYHHFMYSILSASGIEGNWNEFLGNNPKKFSSIEHLIASRNRLSKKNNNASYVYFESLEDTFYLFLKTYGASKYESFFLALSAINIEKKKNIQIRELEEGELTGLPTWAKKHLEHISYGKVNCHSLDMGMDDHRAPIIMFPPALRTPRHRVNVRIRCGEEVCAFCENNDPRDIQAAHIWDVHKLKILSKEGEDNKDLWDYASDGHNGFWLCSVHHRPFDNNTLTLDSNGKILYNTMMSNTVIYELKTTITKKSIDTGIISDNFKFYLNKRIKYLEIKNYIPL